MSLAPLVVDWQLEQVLGFPWYAALTIAADGPEEAFRGLALPTERGHHGVLGLALARGNEVLLDTPPRALHRAPLRHATFDLAPGCARRTLVDLSPLVPAALGAGEYRAVVRYSGGPSQEATSSGRAVIFRAPSAEQLARRARVAERRTQHGSWMAAFDDPPHPSVRGWRLPPNDPFAWPALAALAADDPNTFATLDAATFTGFTTALAPSVELLFLRWLIANRDRPRAREQARALAFHHPGLVPEVEALGLDVDLSGI
jgi:hypothetical protein